MPETTETFIPRTGLDLVLFDAQRQLLSTDKDLRSRAEALIRQMQRLIEHLDDGSGVNSLGEVQSRGLDIDRLCALREERASAIRRLAWAAEKDAEFAAQAQS